MFHSRHFYHTILTAAVVVGAALGIDRDCTAQTATPEVASPSSSTDAAAQPGTLRQQEWLKATPDQRVRIAEEIGERGARRFAEAKGWEPILDGTEKTIPQGFDQVYRGADGIVHVVEAKGGSSQLGHAYGYPQGSSEWAVEAAKRTLRSTKASAAEKTAAKAVLEAAAAGKLQVHVVHTGHVLGEPTAAVLKQTVGTTRAASKAAQSAVDDLMKAAAQSSDDAARTTLRLSRTATKPGATALKTAAKGAVVVGAAVDAGLRISDAADTERRYTAGQITEQEREIAHARNVAGMAGGWTGAAAGAKLGAFGGGVAGSWVAPGLGTAIGGAAGGVSGGIAGYFGGEAAAEAAAQWAVKKVHSAGTTIRGAAKAAWNWATDW
ncbi:MAG: hypothetical protein NUV77_06420 [Thermoguttaceae bacterium]|jgi:hypothetical protein|nr:hypothetical protein [Thermoguttaceae bacterium]